MSIVLQKLKTRAFYVQIPMIFKPRIAFPTTINLPTLSPLSFETYSRKVPKNTQHFPTILPYPFNNSSGLSLPFLYPRCEFSECVSNETKTKPAIPLQNQKNFTPNKNSGRAIDIQNRNYNAKPNNIKRIL